MAIQPVRQKEPVVEPPIRSDRSDLSSDGEDRYSTERVGELLHSLLDLERLDPGLFRSKSLLTPKMARGTFGGQLVAHALQAAQATVNDSNKRVHSLRSNFLLPGDSKIPMYYSVKTLRDGKSFSVRNVVAFQNGQSVYAATVSFHIRESPGVEHSKRFPVDTLSPDQASSQADILSMLIERAPNNLLKENIRRKVAPAVHVRYCRDVTKPIQTNAPTYAWLKCDHVPDDPASHRALAFFASDFTLAFSPLAVHGLPNPNLRMIVSLDHTIYFHDDFSVKDWFLYEVQSPWAGGNRALCYGRYFTQDGRLVMTVHQETLIRMKEGYHSIAKL